MIVSATNHFNTDKFDRLSGDDWYGYLLNQAALRIRTATASALEPLGVSPPQLRVLEAIADVQPLNQARLGDLVQMDRTTIVHVVDHFERIGAATRQADPADRRSHAIVLTKQGQQILVAGRARARAVEAAFLAPLSHSERQTLRTLLRKLFDPTSCPKETESEPSTSPPDPR